MKLRNNRSVFYLISLIAAVLLLAACSSSSKDNSPSVTPTPTTSSIPTPTSAPTAVPTTIPTPAATLTPTMTPVDTFDVRAKELLQKMTLEEKVGQLFFVRLRKAQAEEDIKKYYLGGLILFGDDFKDEDKKSMKKLITGYQSAASTALLIGVDEEGGMVNRVSKYPAFREVPFASPMDLYKEGGLDLIRRDTLEKADLLLSLGINVNLAPVCDVSTDPKDFIYPRSFGKNAEDTSDYVKAVVEVMKEQKLGCTLKHFPGYGNNADTHTGIAVDDRAYDTFLSSDFLPFEAGIEKGADSVLVSHTIVTSMDQGTPASLSAKIHNILRTDLGFRGVIITDDLSMDAIKGYSGEDVAAVLAVLAGNDLLIASDFELQIPAVLDAIKDGTILESRIDASVLRILKWKLNLGILR